VLVLAAASIALGTTAALVHDDLEHVVAYTIVADAGVALLALVALAPAAGQPGRLWLVVFVVVRTAFAGWAAATRMAFGTGRVSELAGWARRAPLLAVALAGLGLAGVGWPGSETFDSRAALVGLSVSGPLANVLLVAGLASVAVYVRLFVAGVRQPGAAVRSGAGPGFVPPRRRGTGRLTARQVTEAWDLNRAPVAAGAVLVLAAIAVAVAGTGLGLRDAAGAPAGARGAAAGTISPP
jgi:NADH:ubiquinone oxidoreductase subunit 2 (subunit N)